MKTRKLNRRCRIFNPVLYIIYAVALFGALPVFGAKQNDLIPEHTTRYYYDRASNYQDAEAWDASKREIDAGLKYYPNDPDLRYLNGRYYYYAQGDLHQARYNLIKAIQENDQHYRAKRVLVDVEDDSKHFSSAICYINELLEFQPYDRDLWRRKIALYRKIGQRTEADHALERLARIYPNDSVVRRDLNNRNREQWNRRLQTTSLTDAASDLEKWLDLDPTNIEYYEELVRVYQKMGDYERAIGAANRGLAHAPGNQNLLKAAASMMAELGNYTRALTFLREHHSTGQLYNSLVRQAADDARWRDPYEANGRLYDMTGDSDALNYLLNTAITRGYYNDALEYLEEAYKKNSRTPELLIKQYSLEKRFGNEKKQYQLLEELYSKRPSDPEILEDYIAMMIELSNRDIEHEQWSDARLHLDKVLSLMSDTAQAWPATVSRQISVLGRMNKLEEARELYHNSVAQAPKYKERFGAAYEEVAAVRLKKLVEDENYDLALKEAESLLEVVEDSEAAMRTCISMAQTLKKDEKFFKYAEIGYQAHPDMPYFIVKKAIALNMQGKPEEALALVRPRNGDDEYINPQLKNAYVAISEEYAGNLLKAHEPEKCLMVLNSALEYDEGNKDLLYMKGLAYAQLHEWGLAYEYQHKYYNPSNAEQAEWYQQMRYLRYRSYKNHLEASYTSAFYDNRNEQLNSIAHFYSLASVTYARLEKNNTYTGQISYKGIDGYVEGDYLDKGGFGLEFLAQWDHVFNQRWSGMVNASYSTKFFNKVGANVAASYDFGKGWVGTLRAGYRLTAPTYELNEGDASTAKRYNVFIATPSVEKDWTRIRTSMGVDLIGMGKGFYYNVGLKGKLFVNEDNISSVGLMAGFGSFPELTFFDQTALSSLSKTNAMVGIEGTYLFTHNFYAGLSGAWNTYYSPFKLESGAIRSLYRNVFSLNLHLNVAF